MKFDDVFKKATPEEARDRKIQYIIDQCKKTRLPDGTWHIHGDLNLTYYNVKTLEDLNVSKVDGYFFCSHNQLTSLKGCPKEVGGFVGYKNFLTSLEYGPVKVATDFYCNDNKLSSLEGCPNEVGGRFICHSNSKEFSEDEVREACDVKGTIHI